MAGRTFQITGRVVERESRGGVPKARVEAWDKDLIFDDLVGAAVTDERGGFVIKFDESYFREAFLDRRPDLFFKVFRDGLLVRSTEDSVLWNIDRPDIELTIEVEVRAVLGKVGGRLRRLLRMSESDLTAAVERERTRLAEESRRIEWLGQILPRDATDEERAVVERLRRIARKRVVPDLVYGPLLRDFRPLIPITVPAIVHFAGNRDDLTSLGLSVGAGAQDVFTVRGTRAQLADLAAQPATLRMRLPRIFLPTVQDAMRQAEIDEVRDLNAPPYEGQGIIVGIIDSALDVTHHAFRDPAGSSHPSRVLYYWAQSTDHGDAADGDDPQTAYDFTGLDSGRVYDRDRITSAVNSGAPFGPGANQIDVEPEIREHGTHVAGIAAGNGYNAAWSQSGNIGAAPKADIVYVKRASHVFENNSSYEDELMEGLTFIFEVSQQLEGGKPTVVNLSLGSNLGPHDGTDLFSTFCDILLDSGQQGRSIVCAAGNDNDKDMYQRGMIPASGTVSLVVSFEESLITWLDVWYSASQEMELQLQVGDDRTDWFPASEGCNDSSSHEWAGPRFHVSPATSTDGMNNVTFQLFPSDPWTITLRRPDGFAPAADSPYHAWLGPAKTGTLRDAESGELTLTNTACGRSLLSVGACAKLTASDDVEQIAPYSGAGPTRDGRIKPEIVAVGGLNEWGRAVCSTNSDQRSGYDAYDSGTSQATPVVTGAIALLLERNPTLSQDAIKQGLTNFANAEGLSLETDPLQRNQYGHGRLRLARVFEAFPRPVDLFVRTASDDYGAVPYLGDRFWNAPEVEIRDASDEPVNILHWDQPYTVSVRVYNLGHHPARGTWVKLFYAESNTASGEWATCKHNEGGLGPVLKTTEDLEDFDARDVSFDGTDDRLTWIPNRDIDRVPLITDGHYCLLVEVSPDELPGTYDAFERDIRGTKNLALKNLTILD